MEHLLTSLQGYSVRPAPKMDSKKGGLCNRTERGELMRYFIETLNPQRKGEYQPLTYSRMGKLLQKVPTKDLYYLKSVMEDKKRRGENYGAYFYWSIKSK